MVISDNPHNLRYRRYYLWIQKQSANYGLHQSPTILDDYLLNYEAVTPGYSYLQYILLYQVQLGAFSAFAYDQVESQIDFPSQKNFCSPLCLKDFIMKIVYGILRKTQW